MADTVIKDANLIYTALGTKKYSKESMELFFDAQVIRLEDYHKTALIGGKAKSFETKTVEKGQMEELVQLSYAIETGEWPIPFWQQVQATSMSFEVQKHLENRV